MKKLFHFVFSNRLQLNGLSGNGTLERNQIYGGHEKEIAPKKTMTPAKHLVIKRKIIVDDALHQHHQVIK